MNAIRLVLDASAVVAFSRGSDHVGEPLTQVVENGADFTVPLAALVTAGARLDRAWIELPTTHVAFRPVDFPWPRWPCWLPRSARWAG